MNELDNCYKCRLKYFTLERPTHHGFSLFECKYIIKLTLLLYYMYRGLCKMTSCLGYVTPRKLLVTWGKAIFCHHWVNRPILNLKLFKTHIDCLFVCVSLSSGSLTFLMALSMAFVYDGDCGFGLMQSLTHDQFVPSRVTVRWSC